MPVPSGQFVSHTERHTALELFTDRRHACRRFEAYLDGETPVPTILFFYGDGGNGKSLLLRFLEEYYCHSRDPRHWTDTEPDDPPSRTRQIPTARLDFAPSGGESHQQAIAGLLYLRRTLATYRLRFPLFDYASILYLKRIQGLPDDHIRSLFPAEEADLVATVIDAITSTTYGAIGKAILGLFNKHFGKEPNEQFTLWLQRRGITADDLDEIQRLDREGELWQELPQFFAKDLNTAMRGSDAPWRLVLFFDSHEAFWGEQRDPQGEYYYSRDKWLRCLLATLDRRHGIVTVVAGREKPSWHYAERCPIAEQDIEFQHIEHLADDNARAYLGHRGITDAAVCEQVLDFARVAVDEVHPLYLGLCADIIDTAAEQRVAMTRDIFGKNDQIPNKGGVLLNRLLSYTTAEVRSAVEILSAARAFNRDIYIDLGKALAFAATRATFATLTKFSFVWPASERGADWFRIHPLVRRLLADDTSKKAMLSEAHVVLEQWYQEHALGEQPSMIAEAIYHSNQRNWEHGIEQWQKQLQDALAASNYQLCEALIQVERDLRIDSYRWRGHVLAFEGEYYFILGRYDAAEREFGNAVIAYDMAQHEAPFAAAVLNDKGNVLTRLGELYVARAKYDLAVQAYRDAIAVFNDTHQHAYDRMDQLANDSDKYDSMQRDSAIRDALSLAESTCHAALFNKGSTLMLLGKLLETRTRDEDSQQAYRDAIAAFEDAALLVSDTGTLIEKARAEHALARLVASLTGYGAAQEWFDYAIRTYEKAAECAPANFTGLMAKGDALIECGGVYIDCANPDKAQELYQDALRTYDSILELTSDPVAHIDACINKGRVWETIGDQLADVQPDDAAEQAYREAIALYNTALQDVPDHDVALACKGFALMRLGDKLANVQRDDAAEQAYHEAIAAYNRILQTYEDHLERLFKPGSQSVYVLHNIGLVLTKLGKLFDLRSDHTQAQRHYEEAIIFYDSVLKNAANTIQTLNDKGRALFRLAESRNATNDRSEAIDALHDAIACWERSLLLGPNDQNIHDLLTAARPRLDEWERGVTL